MKQLIMLVATILVSSISYANVHTSNLNKHSPALNTIASAFTTHKSIQTGQHDITIVYGGADVSQQLAVISAA